MAEIDNADATPVPPAPPPRPPQSFSASVAQAARRFSALLKTRAHWLWEFARSVWNWDGRIDEHGDYQPLREPRGWCLDLTGKPCPADAAARGSTAQAGTSR